MFKVKETDFSGIGGGLERLMKGEMTIIHYINVWNSQIIKIKIH